MGQPSRAVGAAGGHPMSVPPARRPPRADPVASALLMLGGALGIWQLLLPWRAVTVDPPATRGDVSITGWQVYRLLRSVPDATGDLQIATYSVLGAAVGGGALFLLGLTMLAAVNHRPVGLAALLVSLLCIAGAGWMLVRARAIFDVGLFTLFAQAQIGWYLFLAAGFLGLAGSWKALATG